MLKLVLGLELWISWYQCVWREVMMCNVSWISICLIIVMFSCSRHCWNCIIFQKSVQIFKKIVEITLWWQIQWTSDIRTPLGQAFWCPYKRGSLYCYKQPRITKSNFGRDMLWGVPMASVKIGSCRTYFRYSIEFCHSDVIWRQKLSFPTSGISTILSIIGLTSWRHLYRAHKRVLYLRSLYPRFTVITVVDSYD
jgi:hypothetical protein